MVIEHDQSEATVASVTVELVLTATHSANSTFVTVEHLSVGSVVIVKDTDVAVVASEGL